MGYLDSLPLLQSRPLLRSCTSPPAILCWAGCHSSPVSCKATLLRPCLTSCCNSRAAHSSTGQPTQPLCMAAGGATCTRSTHGCGSLGAAGLAWRVCQCLRPRIGARQSTGLGRRGVARPASAARQRRAEMNETYGTCTFEGYPGITRFRNIISNLSWVMQVNNFFSGLSWVMQF